MSVEAEFFRQIKEHMEETEQQRLTGFVEDGTLTPINKRQVLNCIKELENECIKRSEVFFCSPDTKREILSQFEYLPFTCLVASKAVPEGVMYVVTDDKMKEDIIRICKR